VARFDEAVDENPWIRAIEPGDLPLSAGLVRDLAQIGVNTVGELVGTIYFDRVAAEDHSDLVRVIGLALSTAGMVAAIDAGTAWQNLCSSSYSRRLPEIAETRQCSMGAIIDLGRRAGAIREVPSQLDFDQVFFAPDPSLRDLGQSTRAIRAFSDKVNEVLDERSASIAGLRSVGQRTLEEMGQAFGITRERVRQLESKARKTIYERVDPNLIIEAATPVAFAIEDYGGGATLRQLSSTLRIDEPTIGLVLESAHRDRRIRDLVPISISGLHSPFEFEIPSRSHRDIRLRPFKVHEELVEAAIGPSRIVRGSEFVQRLQANMDAPFSCSHVTLSARLSGLERMGMIAVGSVHPFEENQFGPWVISPTTTRTTQIIKAMLRAGSYDAVERGGSSDLLFHAPDGIPNHVLTEQLDRSGGVRISEHGLEAFCSRYPEIFIKSGMTSWGLIGAGATPFDAAIAPKLDHGTTSDLLVWVLDEAEEALQLHEIIGRMREIEPLIKEMSVRLYLNTLNADRFTNTDGYYQLSENYQSRRNIKLPFGATIKTLIKVLTDAEQPLSLDEIVDECRQLLPIEPSAIRGYLDQNYHNLFRKLHTGKYVLGNGR